MPQQLQALNMVIRGCAKETEECLHSLYDHRSWNQIGKLISSDQNVCFMNEQYLHIAARLV